MCSVESRRNKTISIFAAIFARTLENIGRDIILTTTRKFVEVRIILVNGQLDALFLNVFISTPLHVSSSKCSSPGGSTCINTPSGITHSGG